MLVLTETLTGPGMRDELLFRKTHSPQGFLPLRRRCGIARWRSKNKVRYKRSAAQDDELHKRTALPSPLPVSVEPLRNILDRSLTLSITSTSFSPASADLLRSKVGCTEEKMSDRSKALVIWPTRRRTSCIEPSVIEGGVGELRCGRMRNPKNEGRVAVGPWTRTSAIRAGECKLAETFETSRRDAK